MPQLRGEGGDQPHQPSTKYYSAKNKSPHLTLLRTVLAWKCWGIAFGLLMVFHVLYFKSYEYNPPDHSLSKYSQCIFGYILHPPPPHTHNNEIKTTPTALLFDLLQTFIKGITVKLSFIVIAFVGDGSRSVILCKSIKFGQKNSGGFSYEKQWRFKISFWNYDECTWTVGMRSSYLFYRVLRKGWPGYTFSV